MATVSCFVFDHTQDGQSVAGFKVKNEDLELIFMEFGACLVSIKCKDKDGKVEDVVTGFEKVNDYANNDKYFGSIVGRIANRTREGKFTLNGINYSLPCNNGPNHLHGGYKGFDKKLWKGTVCDNGVNFKVRSPDRDEGCPGNMDVSVTYILNKNELAIQYEVTCDQDTPLNITNHSYFNLSGHSSWGNLDNHKLTVFAEHYTPLDDTLVTTGEIRQVKGSLFDLRTPVKLTLKQFNLVGNGYDHNFCMQKDGQRHFAAKLEHDSNGRIVTMETTQPGVQVYTGNFLEGEVGKGGVKYEKQSAICFEAQNWPDAINKPDIFPNAVLRVGDVFKQSTWYKFTTTSS